DARGGRHVVDDGGHLGAVRVTGERRVEYVRVRTAVVLLVHRRRQLVAQLAAVALEATDVDDGDIDAGAEVVGDGVLPRVGVGVVHALGCDRARGLVVLAPVAHLSDRGVRR